VGAPTALRERQRLVRQITSCWRTQALHAAVQLDLPDHLAAGRRDVQEIAVACNCSPEALRRLLKALCTLGVCLEHRDGSFELTPGGAALCREPPDGAPTLRALALWWGGPMWPLWADLGYSVQTGLSARAHRTGLSNYAFLEQQPAQAALFHEAMRAMTGLIAQEVAQLAVWGDATYLVDVGGGNGEMAAAVASSHPQLRVCVLDRADAQAGAHELFRRRGLRSRASFVAGDFFQAVPPGADRYLLKSILHNWDDPACRRILQCCGAAAPRAARLLVIERIRCERLRPTRRHQALARTDLNMLAGLGGRERSLREFRGLLSDAGFEIAQVTRTQHEFSVIEAVRI